MPGFQRHILIDRPTQEVFDFATNPHNAPRIVPTVKRIDPILRAGEESTRRYRETRFLGGKERSAVIEIVEHQRPEVYTTRCDVWGMSATYCFRFHPEGDGTRIELDAIMDGNWIWRLFGLKLIASAMEKEDGDYLDRLKHVLEAPG